MGRLEQRKRNRNERKRKSVIVIGCEGKNKTETNYFRNFSSRKCVIKFSTGRHTDPVGMVKDLIEYIRNEDISIEYGDKIYLLLDTDINQNKQSQIEDAKKMCRDYGIELITSTPTFEYWYILHNEKTTKKYGSSKQVKDELKEKIEGYTESMDVYNILKSKTDEAIKNAIEIEEYYTKNGQDLDSEEANPHTSVYKVIQEIYRRNNIED